MQNKIDILMICVLLISFLTLLAGDAIETNSKYISSASTTTELKVAKWDFKLNGTNDASIDINLKETLSEDNEYSTTEVIPGTSGTIPLNIDCTNSQVALDYTITLTANVPANLKFYTDSEYTTEYSDISSFVGLNDNKVINHDIYWKWDFTEDDETTDWSNQNLIVTITVTASQRIDGDNT